MFNDAGNEEGFPSNAPQKMNMQPENTPMEKEYHLLNASVFFGSM